MVLLEVIEDHFINLSFPSELINWAFEIIRLVSWQGMPLDFLVVFAAMAMSDLFLLVKLKCTRDNSWHV